MREHIAPLFSVPLGIYRWDDDKNKELKELTQKLIKPRKRLGNAMTQDICHFYNVSGENFLDEDYPVIKEFEKFLSESYEDFTQNVYEWDMCREHIITDCWVNVTRKNGWQFKHSHANAFISGTYYLNFPDGSPGLTLSNSTIQKTSPYLGVNPKKMNPYNSETLTMMPDEGILFLWSSNLTHETGIIEEDITRVSISMNFVPAELDTGVYRLRLSR
tara:strand:+ start:1456 stop:2106 length:651 start_codon:yes stop_codon:yes gene_type:complete